MTLYQSGLHKELAGELQRLVTYRPLASGVASLCQAVHQEGAGGCVQTRVYCPQVPALS